jgi:hypothetical protein
MCLVASALGLQAQNNTPVLSGPLDFGPLASDPPTCFQLGSRYFNTTSSVTRVCTAAGTPGTWANIGGSSGGGDTIASPNGTLNVGGTPSNTTLDAKTTLIAQKFFGTAAPGSVSGNLPGDLYTDTTNHNEYVCNAPSGTGAPACTSVSAAGWLQVNGGGGGSGYSTVQSPPGTALTPRAALAVTGNLKATDDSSNARTQIQADPFGAAGNASVTEFDEFTSTFPGTTSFKLGWHISSGSGASVTDIAGLANHPGIVDLDTSSTSGGNATMGLTYNNSSFVLASTTNWEFQFIVRIPTATTNENVWVGFADIATADLRNDQNDIAFSYNPGTDAHWRVCVGSNAPTSTCAATTITVATTSWYRLRIRSTTAGVALFSVATDGGAFSAEITAGTGQTVNASLPAMALSPGFYIDNTSTANDRHLYVDYFAYQMLGLNR